MVTDNTLRIVHEHEIIEAELPGRSMRWLASGETLGAESLSVCVIRVSAGSTVNPAHSHPQGEEFIYILNGEGRVLVDGRVGAVRAGTGVLFPRNSVHMLQNSGDVEMKVICFFAPPAHPDNYDYHDSVEFPTEQS